MKRLSFLLFILLITGLFTKAEAQFEGQIEFQLQNLEEPAQSAINLNMIFFRERIYVESNASMAVLPGLNTSAVLVRNDHRDFVMHTGEYEALKVTKDDLDGLINLIERFQGSRASNGSGDSFDWDTNVTETGQKREIHGYTVSEFQMRGDGEDEYISVWLTDQIKVNWGLLNEAWQTTGRNHVGEDIPIELVMNRNSFPLMIESYRNGEVIFRAESVNVETGVRDRRKTRVSSDTKLLGITDLMMNMLRQ
ncbi:MAG: hypothetical protein JJU46_11975 [Balneolaceae bacterium]|nr:hypothetical protein [Balneolaceae bacterium]MCH8548561.1 hypothetical protein [Balneolaceae bacterium]